MWGILCVMAWPGKLGSFLACFTVNLVICCALAGLYDLDKQDNVVGAFIPHNRQGYGRWTSKKTASKDTVLIGKIILLGSSQKGRKGDNLPHRKDLHVDPFSSSLEDTSEYQSDADWNALERLQGEVYGPPSSKNPAVKRLLEMEPSVQCRDNFMTLHVKGSLLRSSLMVDGGDGSLLPLSQLPSRCGYSVKTTWRDMVFTAPYDGCYGIQEGGSHILPLHWLGTPMKMACPHRPSTAPASVTCYPSGMVVKIDAPQVVANELNIKFKNEWKPLLWVSAQCGYSVVTHPGGLIVTAPFTPCHEMKDGIHSIEILEGKIKLSCPSAAVNVGSVVDFITVHHPETPVPAYFQTPKPAPAPAAPWSPGFVYPQPLKPTIATPKPIPTFPEPSKPASATAAPWIPGFVFPEPSKPASATAVPWIPGFVFPEPSKPASATAAPWIPGFVFPEPSKPASATAVPWIPGFVFPEPSKPASATAVPWIPGFVFPEPSKPASATAAPWIQGFVFPEPSKPASATAVPWIQGFVFPEPSKPASAPAAPWSPGFVYPQPLKPTIATPKHLPTFPHPSKPVPATAAPWFPGFLFPQPSKPALATAAPRPAPTYPKPETRRDALPPHQSYNSPIPPWSVYLQPAASTWGPRRFYPPYRSPPPAGYPCGYSNCWPISYHQHNHLHLDSGNFADCAQVSALAREPHPASYVPVLPYSKNYNLQYAPFSSKSLLGGSAIQLPTPALPPQVSHQAFKNYWDLVVPFSSSQSNPKGPSALHSTSLSQEAVDVPLPHPHLGSNANNYWSDTRPLYPAPQTPKQPIFPHQPVQHFSNGHKPRW